VAGSDRDLDLAVVAVDTGDAPAIEWEGASDPPEIGTAVVALANPGGRGLRATLGLVSSAGRSFRGPRGRRVRGAIEHTAPLPRGSGGGPLLDAEGRVLGINALRPAQGLLLAWPATALRERAATLAAGGRTAPPTLGVALADARQTRRLRAAVGLPEVDGLLVRGVQDDSPAARAGLTRGDVLVEAGGRPVSGFDVIYAALDAHAGGAALPLTILRGTDTVAVTLEPEGDAA
jgi:serine protease Do